MTPEEFEKLTPEERKKYAEEQNKKWQKWLNGKLERWLKGPKFADGGIVSGPTKGLIGENKDIELG